MLCPTCSASLVEGAASCRVCGALLAPSAADAMTVSPTTDLLEGRFPIASVVGERYRILGLVGAGGMGEVYRAHDLRLDQQVALKFLPPALGRDGAAIARFHNEVRTARQVSHPNVCRVHDIGDADGVPFISMEFIDGDDLAVLLQRIGRLPQDKGIEVAHAICAGLAAAHAKGVLHRDLKPANIMLNRAGRVVIMDFGLAGIAAQLRGADALAGTPAYMAPEQVRAEPPTTRSDIYALGLVLYEMFTGARAFTGLVRHALVAPSHIVKDLSPAIDRIVLACLEDDPARRPPSAMAIAQLLPGGDPIAAAMQAGQTPSPEMVGASRATATLTVRGAVACFVALFALLVAVYGLTPGFRDIGLAPLEVPPEVLVARARDIATAVGYAARPRDYAFGFERDEAHLDYLEAQRFDWRRLASHHPGTVVWWYRESPGWLSPRGSSPSVTRDDPPRAAGGVDLVLDPRSRKLLAFTATPQRRRATQGASAGPPGAEPDWRPLFDAAGLDPTRFTAAAPESAPAGGFDFRRAWTGPAARDVAVRIEAASLNGRPVSFVVVFPWSADTEAGASDGRLVGMPAVAGFVAIAWTAMVVGVVLAWRNYRLRRWDTRGGTVLATATFCLMLAAWLLTAHLTPTVSTLMRLWQALATSLFGAVVTFVIYAGAEPSARRYWPASLVSWTRLVNGRLRDPLVGQDLLVGALVGLAGPAILLVYHVVALQLSARPMTSGSSEFRTVTLSLAGLLGRYADIGAFALWGSAGGLAVLLVLEKALRRKWPAMLICAVTGGMAWAPALGPSYPLLAAVFLSASFVPWVWTLRRYGMLASIVTTWVLTVSMGAPTANLALWYGPNALVGAVFILALGGYGLRTVLAGRPLWRRRAFDAERVEDGAFRVER